MIKLRELHVKNFLSFKEFHLDLRKAGLYLISGWNDRGQDSNGAGKSAVLESICFGLFGKTSHGLTWEKVKRWDTQEDLYVKIVLAKGEEDYVIERTNNSVVSSLRDGSLHKRDTQLSINEAFNTSYELFLASVMFVGGKTDFLAGQSDAEKKKVLSPLFKLDHLSRAYDKAKNKFTEVCDEIDALKLSAGYLRSQISNDNDFITTCIEKEKKWEQEVDSQISMYQQKIQELNHEMDAKYEKAVLSARRTYDNLRSSMESEKEFLEGWREELQSSLSFCHQAKTSIEKIEGILQQSQSMTREIKCEYCGESLNRKNLARHIREMIAEKGKHILAEKEYKERALELEGRILNYHQKEEQLNGLERNYNNALHILQLKQSEKESNQQRIKEYETQIAKTYEMKKNNPHTHTIQGLKTRIVSMEKEMEQIMGKLEIYNKTADAYSFLKWVFSKEGLPAFIIERAFGRIESLANRYLSLISSEEFQIEIKPQRELKSKAVKEEIDIVVKTGNRRILYYQMSDGQRQRLNIAMLLALYRLCRDMGINNFDFLLLDEVLDLSLADKGQSDAINLMRRLLSTEIHSIFVISHRPEIAQEFDYVIEVVRNKNGISEIT